MKRDLPLMIGSMIREIDMTADEVRSQIDRLLEEIAGGADYLMSADHVVRMEMHLPRAEMVQLNVGAWGSGPTANLYETKAANLYETKAANLYETKEGDYEVLLVLRKKKA